MASSTQGTWVWVSFGNCWWTGKPGMLQSMGSQSWHDWVTELNWYICEIITVNYDINIPITSKSFLSLSYLLLFCDKIYPLSKVLSIQCIHEGSFWWCWYKWWQEALVMCVEVGAWRWEMHVTSVSIFFLEAYGMHQFWLPCTEQGRKQWHKHLICGAWKIEETRIDRNVHFTAGQHVNYIPVFLFISEDLCWEGWLGCGWGWRDDGAPLLAVVTGLGISEPLPFHGGPWCCTYRVTGEASCPVQIRDTCWVICFYLWLEISMTYKL